MDREFRSEIEDFSSLIRDHEILDYSSPEVIWDDDNGYIIENESKVLEDLVLNGLTQSESKTMLKEYKENLKKATSIITKLIKENVISTEDEIWDYIDEDDDDFYDEDD